MFPSVGPAELTVVFIVVLILFGPGKLPEVFKALGDGVRQFKEASRPITTLPEPKTQSSEAPSQPISQ